MHHSPSGPPFRARRAAVFSRLRLPRPTRRGTIAPVVLVCGILAGIALVLPSYAPAVTGTHGAFGLDPTGAASAGALRSDSSAPAGRRERADVVAPEATAAPSSTVPTPAPVVGTPPAPESTPAAGGTQPAETAPSSSSEPAPSSAPDTSAPAPAPGPAPAPAAEAAADAGDEAQILALVNQQRAAAGCGTLAADDDLASVARAFSADMRDRGFFSHTDPDGLSPFDRGDRAGVTVLAENIASGQPDPASVMTAWMNSAGHRANILNCSYTRLGVGVAYGPGGPWWTQDFA